MPQLGVVTEYRYGAGQLERFRPETPQSHEHASSDGAGGKVEDGGRTLLSSGRTPPAASSDACRSNRERNSAPRCRDTPARGRRGVREAGLP